MKEKYSSLKLIYARGDDKSGHLAISNLRLKKDLVDQLVAEGMTVNDKKLIFEKPEGEALKTFWQE